MNRTLGAVCLSLSLIAIALAAYLPRANSSRPEAALMDQLDRIAVSVESLGDRIERLEMKATADSRAETARDRASSAVVDRLDALQARVEALDDAETIAQLAEAGGEELRSEAARAVLDGLLDPELTPEERKQRIEAYWRQNGRLSDLVARSGLSEDDVFPAILRVAQDPALEESVRLKLLSDIEDSKILTLREPLMSLARFDAARRVRQQAVRNLVAHAADVDAQNTILAAYREDPDDQVRATAQRRLQEVFLVAQEATPGSPITTTLTEEDLGSRGEAERRENAEHERRRRIEDDLERERADADHESEPSVEYEER